MITTRFRVPAMDCATEKNIIASRLEKLSEVQKLDFDLMERIVTVHHAEGGADAVQAALDDVGMDPQRLVETQLGGKAEPPPEAKHGFAEVAWQRNVWLISAACVIALATEVLSWTVFAENSWPIIALSLTCIVLSGPATFRKGLIALRTRTLNINLLMTIAVAGAIAIQQWPEAAMVTALFAVAEVIEARSTDRARDAIRSLMALTPDQARVQRDGAWVDVPAGEVKPGDIVQVLPGDRVPLDGKIANGTTSIDQAPITGESMPVDKKVGDGVFAGTINQQGVIEVSVTSGQGDSTLARIGRTIREAQSQRAPSERFVDRFSAYYTPIVVLLAIGIATVPPLVFGQAFQPWLYKALVMLVIACPCALVISTPVTIVSGLAAAARRGILVKGGVHLERARHLRMLALDKTGTLTEGSPQLMNAIPLNGTPKDDLVRIAASLEATSTHPIAQAIVRAHQGELMPVTDSRNIVGKGLQGVVAGNRVTIGSHRLAEELKVCSPEIEKHLESLESQGASTMIVIKNHQVVGVLGVADKIRATSVEAIRALHNQGIKLTMLTGDNTTTANAVGKKVGIDEVEAELLPEQKLATMDRLVQIHEHVGMVGDGVNDAPALARATIGFAMGAAGTDTALETADVALMKDDLRGIPELVALSRRVARTLKLNIGFSIAVKVVFFVLALTGVATLWMAVFADLGASLIVAANGLSVLRYRPNR